MFLTLAFSIKMSHIYVTTQQRHVYMVPI